MCIGKGNGLFFISDSVAITNKMQLGNGIYYSTIN